MDPQFEMLSARLHMFKACEATRSIFTEEWNLSGFFKRLLYLSVVIPDQPSDCKAINMQMNASTFDYCSV